MSSSSAAAPRACRLPSACRSWRRRAAASRRRSRCSRRRARPARICCRVPCSISSALARSAAGLRALGAPLLAAGRPRARLLPHRAPRAARPDHSAAARQPRQRARLAQPARHAGWPSWPRPPASISSPASPARRCCSTARAWSASAPAIAAAAGTARRRRTSSRAWTSTPRSPSSATACAATSPSSCGGAWPLGAGARARAVRHRHQGTVGGAGGPHRDRHGDRTRSGIRCATRSSAAASSTRCPIAWSRSGSWSASTTTTRCSIRTSPSTASSATRCVARLLDGRTPGPLRRQGAARRRLEHRAARPRDGALIAGDAAELRELGPPQGHPSRDAHRDAGRRDRVRGAAGRRHQRRRAWRRTSAARRQRRCGGSWSRCAACTRRSATGCCRGCCSPARRCSRADAGSADLARRPGHTRMRTLRWYYGIEMASPARAAPAAPPDRVLTFDKLTNVHFAGTAHDEDQPVAPAGAHRGVHVDLRPGIRASVHAVLPGQRLRDRARAGRRAAPADQRVELRALQDVRHHGSLRRHHLGAARRRRRSAVHGM